MSDDTDRRIVDWQQDLDYGDRWARARQPLQRALLLILWTACVWMFATQSAEADCEPYRADPPATSSARVETVYPPSMPTYDIAPAVDAGATIGAILADTFTTTTTTTNRSKL